MSENCSKLRENIAREKADINRRNIEKYEASKQIKAKGQEDTYRTQQGRTDNGGQSKQVPKQATSPGGPHPHPGGMGGTGGEPPRKPNGDKNLPPDKIDQEEEEQEEEDSDHTITVSESTSGEGVRIVKGDGTELSLKQLLKLVGRSKRR